MHDALDFRLLNEFQRGFPLCRAPFAELAARLGVGEGTVLQRLEAMRREGKISRVGAVFAPKRIGASTLAAMAVPAEELAEVADIINRFPEVNHNYAREHRYNLWFVVTAASESRLDAALGAMQEASGLPLLKLPLLEEFHIDLGFPLHAPPAGERTVTRRTFAPSTPIDEAERRLVSVLQEGLPLFFRPFQLIAERINATEGDVMQRIGQWLDEGVIKRFGVVVRHRELGYTANAMWVQDLPDGLVSQLGQQLAAAQDITLCYRRPRILPAWPYNLFCMIHGQSREEVLARIAALREQHGLTAYEHDVLFSTTRYKQTGARYA